MILTETKINNSICSNHTYFTVHYYCTYIWNVCVVLVCWTQWTDCTDISYFSSKFHWPNNPI